MPWIGSAQVLHWAAGVSGSSNEAGNAVAIDAQGNVYTTGFFRDIVDFDPGAGIANLTAAGIDIFVLKLDKDGNFLWAKSAGNVNSNMGQGIATDAAGNVYVTGSFSDSVDFDPGPGSNYLTSAGSSDAFVLKLDGAGNFVWAKSMGGASSDYSYSIALDTSGNVFTTGNFFSSGDFDPGAGNFTLTSAGAVDVFISKLDNNGNFLWAGAIGGTDDESGTAITIDVTQVINLTGSFKGTADLDPGAGVSNFTSAGEEDIFYAVLDNNGNYYFAKTMGGPLSDVGRSLILDASLNVYITGTFQDVADFDPDGGTANLTAAGGLDDMFISKLDLNGAYVWAQGITGPGIEIGYSIGLDALDNIYTTGFYSDNVDFDPGAGTFTLTTAGYEVFILRLDNAGNFIYAKSSEGSSNTRGRAIAVDDLGRSHVTGSFEGTVDFNPDAGVSNLTSAGSNAVDMYVLKYGPCTNTFSSITDSGCQFYNLNGTIYTVSGSYSQTIANALGCDSIISLSITITQPNIAVVQNGASLMASATGVFYQWIDCTNGNVQINGATNQTYNATIDGSYAVIITQGNCADTSVCYNVTGTGITDNQISNVNVYPNPVSELLTIQTNETIETITIYNTVGNLVMQQNTKTFSVADLAKGIYQAVVKTNKGFGTVRFVVE